MKQSAPCGRAPGVARGKSVAMECDPLPSPDDVALFATRVPPDGLGADLQALAAMVDEDEPGEGEGGPSSRKRKAASIGTAQVHLALASCGDAPPRGGASPPASPPAKHRRSDDARARRAARPAPEPDDSPAVLAVSSPASSPWPDVLTL